MILSLITPLGLLFIGLAFFGLFIGWWVEHGK